jgi:hypothetical protein
MRMTLLRSLGRNVQLKTFELCGIRPGHRLLALCALACASCQLLVDSSKTQCREHSDCEELFGSDTDLVCMQSVCALPTCTTDEDCSRFGDKYAGTVCSDNSCELPVITEPPEWECLDTMPQAPTASGRLQVQAHYQHMVSQSPMKNVSVRVCRKLDVECTNPESTGMTDTNGDVTLDVPAAFTGYMAAEGMSTSGVKLMPTRYYFSPAVNEDLNIASIQLVEPALATALVMNASMTSQLEDRGLVLLSAFDCMQVGAAGISFESADADEQSKAFYAVMSLPSATATETATGGFGGFLNAPAGNFRIDAKRASDGRKIGEVAVLVRPGELTITRLVATYQSTAP